MLRARGIVLLPLILCCGTLGANPAQHAAPRLVPLDGTNGVLQGVRILAMTMGPDGTIYAGGRDTHDPRTPGQPNPLGLGSVFLISHDHGAHWTKRVNEEPSPGYIAQYPKWTDPTRWPPNFTVSQLVVDPHHPTTLYAAGGFPFGHGGRGSLHLLLRSTNGGRTWSEPLLRQVNLNARTPLVTNIAVTPANRQTLTYTRIEEAPALAIDPQESRRLYLATDWLGVLRSTDGGASWLYTPGSPTIGTGVSEQVAIDPTRSHTLYVLVQGTTFAALYGSQDRGATWRAVWHGDFAGGVLPEGHTVYLVRVDGIYASTDGGAHWHLTVNARTLPSFTMKTSAGTAGAIVQALHDRDAGLWIAMVVNYQVDGSEGLYATRNNGAMWTRLTNGQRGRRFALAVGDMEYGYTRLWLDTGPQAPILFTPSEVDGLYRWRLVL